MASTLPPRGPGKKYVDELREPLRLVMTFLEGGSNEAFTYHEQHHDDQLDPWYFTHTVRRHLCRELDNIIAAGNVNFSRTPLPFSGVELTYGKYRVKVLKAGEDGALPVAT